MARRGAARRRALRSAPASAMPTAATVATVASQSCSPAAARRTGSSTSAR